MPVTIEGIADPQSGIPCRLEIDINVAARIQYECLPGIIIPNEIGSMAQTLEMELCEEHLSTIRNSPPGCTPLEASFSSVSQRLSKDAEGRADTDKARTIF